MGIAVGEVPTHTARPPARLAWLLKRSSVMLPIPGTTKVAHLRVNVAAVDVTLTAGEFTRLDGAGSAAAKAAAR